MKLSKTDWAELTPDNFEKLCSDLLSYLGFSNVLRLGGSGDKGRDIICRRSVELNPSVVLNLNWVVQCKHCFGGLKKSHILDDLAKASEHSFDLWMLMTTANITASWRDWFEELSRNKRYSFRIHYMDRQVLERLLAQYPKVLSKYFPDKLDASEQVLVSAISMMSEQQYDKAIQILQNGDDSSNPRFSYLLACCYSMVGGYSMDKEANGVRSLGYLAEAFERGYIDYLSNRFAWPNDKSLFEIHRDPELRFIKQHKPQHFNSIVPPPKAASGGSCFTSDTLIRISYDTLARISQVRPNQEVISRIDAGVIRYSRVRRVFVSIADTIILINSDLKTTFNHRIHTMNGWRRAGELTIGDFVTTINGPRVISLIRYEHGPTQVYNIILNGIPTYYANNYLVHNKFEVV